MPPYTLKKTTLNLKHIQSRSLNSKKLSPGRFETYRKLWSSIAPQLFIFIFASIWHHNSFSIENPTRIPPSSISLVNPIEIDQVGQKFKNLKSVTFLDFNLA